MAETTRETDHLAPLRALHQQFVQSRDACIERKRLLTIAEADQLAIWLARGEVWDLAARCVENALETARLEIANAK